MSRLRLFALTALLLAPSACFQASDADCERVGEKVTKMAGLVGKEGESMQRSTANRCKEARPSRAIIQCIIDAQDRAALDNC